MLAGVFGTIVDLPLVGVDKPECEVHVVSVAEVHLLVIFGNDNDGFAIPLPKREGEFGCTANGYNAVPRGTALYAINRSNGPGSLQESPTDVDCS